MKFGVVVFPGSNCDHDAYHVTKHLIKQPSAFLWHKEEDLQGCDVIILPGGFSYGDYLRCGAIARFSPIMKSVQRFAAEGGKVIGICNGFQILVECGLLAGTLLPNDHLKFTCRHVHIRVETTRTPYTALCHQGEVLQIPVAHHDGNFYADGPALQELEANAQVVFRYCDQNGAVTADANPNGSVEGIAGICNREGNILGMMPHPERAAEAILGSADGLVLFNSLLSKNQAKL